MSDWYDEANCKGVDTNIFFPEDYYAWPDREMVEDMCNRCPVRLNCIDAAVSSPDVERGWWGIDEWFIRDLRAKKPAIDPVAVTNVAVALHE